MPSTNWPCSLSSDYSYLTDVSRLSLSSSLFPARVGLLSLTQGLDACLTGLFEVASTGERRQSKLFSGQPTLSAWPLAPVGRGALPLVTLKRLHADEARRVLRVAAGRADTASARTHPRAWTPYQLVPHRCTR
jgi:hypothetical protein